MLEKIKVFLFTFIICVVSYSCYLTQELISEVKLLKEAEQQNRIDYNQIRSVIKNEMIANSTADKEFLAIKELLNEYSDAYKLYSKEYINLLTHKVKENKDLLYQNEISSFSKKQFDALMEQYSLETYHDGVNKGVIKDVNKQDSLKKDVLERIKKVTNLSNSEINKVLNQ